MSNTKQKKNIPINQNKIKSDTTNHSRFFFQNIKPAYLLLGILAITFIAFSNSLKNDFVLNWDDENFVILNPYIQNLSWQSIQGMFSNFWKGNYFPITELSYAVDKALFGFNTTAFHTINLFIHLLNVSLVFLLIKKLTGRIEAAIIVAILFGIHPMQTESVSWVAERKNVLYGMFYLASIILYLKYLEIDKKKNTILILSLCAFILSCLSKPAATTLPVILFLFDYLKKRKLSLSVFIEKIPFFIVAFIIGITTIFAQKSSDSLQNISSFNLFEKALFIPYEIVFYLLKLFVPANLSAYYYYPSPLIGLTWEYYASPLLLILLIWGILKTKVLKRELIFCSLFFLGGMSIMLQIIAVNCFVADRFIYIPSIGIFLAIAYLYIYIYDNKIESLQKLKIPFSILLVLIIFIFSIATWNRNTVWRNAVTLFDDVVAKSPDRDFGYNYRGIAKAITYNDHKGCIEDQNKAIAINPKYAEAYYARGLSKQSLKDLKGGFDDFKKAAEIKTNYPDAYNNMGSILLQIQKFPEAMTYIDLAIKYNEHHEKALYNKGVCFYYLKDMNQACLFWNKAIQAGSTNAVEMKKKYCK